MDIVGETLSLLSTGELMLFVRESRAKASKSDDAVQRFFWRALGLKAESALVEKVLSGA